MTKEIYFLISGFLYILAAADAGIITMKKVIGPVIGLSVADGYCSAEILDEAMYDHFQPKYAQWSIS